LTVPSTATLGTVNAVAARLALIVAYNAGTPVFCIANLAGGVNLDETLLISPTVISTGATSASVIYSASAVAANSPFRVVGFVDITEATAGTWATAPTVVQGIGGQALATMSSLGYGQTWQTFTVGTQRITGTTYYNTTGKPMFVSISTALATSGAVGLTIGAVAVSSVGPTTTNNSMSGIFAIIPPGASYVQTGAVPAIWAELR
jgi:hypothetical protein